MSHDDLIVVAKDSFQTKRHQEILVLIWTFRKTPLEWDATKVLAIFFTQKLYLSNLWITFSEPMDQPFLRIICGFSEGQMQIWNAFSLSLVWDLNMWTVLRGQGPGWDVKKFGGEQALSQCMDVPTFSLKLLWVLDTLVLFASDMWSCEMFFGRQWKHHSIQNMPPLFLPKKAPCFGSFRTSVHFPEVYHSLLFPKEKPIQTTRFPTFLGPSTGPIWPVKTTKEKTLNAHEATVTSLSASPPTAPYDPRLVSCSKAWNKNCLDIKSGYGGVWRFELCQLCVVQNWQLSSLW